MSYATQQEAVARALHQLLTDPQPLDPHSPDSTGTVLACRDQALKALRERLTYLAGSSEKPAVGSNATVTSLTHRPVHHLARVLDALSYPPVPQVVPSDVLGAPATTAAASPEGRWRTVARSLLLGTAELTRADHQPWTHQPAAGWHLVGDTATTLEALLVLDERLTAAGHLPHDPDPDRRREPMAQRLVVTQAARLAHWFGTDPAADLATSSIRHELGVGGHPPVTLVRHAGDFAAAQRTLVALLQGQAELLRPGSDQRPGLLAARALATGQIHLATAFATAADRANEHALAEQFRARIPAWRTLHVSTTRLAEVQKRRSPLLLAQQSEMVIALRAPTGDRLTAADLRDLDRATHELTVTLGRALRHEALETHNIVALDSEHIGLPRPEPMTSTGWAFTAACQRLADEPAPRSAEPLVDAPRQREQLRRTLEETVIGKPPPLRGMQSSFTSGPMPPGLHPDRGRRPSL